MHFGTQQIIELFSSDRNYSTSGIMGFPKNRINILPFTKTSQLDYVPDFVLGKLGTPVFLNAFVAMAIQMQQFNLC